MEVTDHDQVSHGEDRAETGLDNDQAAGGLSILRQWQGRFATQFAAGAPELVAPGISSRPAGWLRCSYNDFLATIQDATCCSILYGFDASGNFSAPVWLELDAPAAHAVVDILLGGPDGPSSDGSYVSARSELPLTAVERRLITRLAELVGRALAESYPGMKAPTFMPADGLASAGTSLGGETAVAVMNFTLTAGSVEGNMRICVPQPLLGEEFERGGWASRRTGPVEISATIGDITLAEDDLEGLAVGDIITTDTPSQAEVIVRVAGIPKYMARLGSCNGRRAVTITRRICPADDRQTNDELPSR